MSEPRGAAGPRHFSMHWGDGEIVEEVRFVWESDFGRDRIVEFAKGLRIHPGIVVGRLQHLELVPWRSGLNSLRDRLEWSD
jgi:hypothetical protein